MIKRDAFANFTAIFHQDWYLIAEDFDDLLCVGASWLSEEERLEVKQIFDRVLESGDVAEAQRVWRASSAGIWFYDEFIMENFRLMSEQLGKPDPQPKMIWLKKT